MKPSLRSSLLIGILATLGILFWQSLEVRSSNREHIQEHQRYGEALLHSFEGVVLRECRRGLYVPKQLRSVFDQTRKRFALRWVALRGPDNQVILSSGHQPNPPTQSLFRSPFEPLVPRHKGLGPPFGAGPFAGGARRFAGEKKLPPGPLYLEIALPQEELTAKLEQDRRRALLTSIALISALILLLFLFHARLRSLSLQTELQAKEEKMKGLEYLGRLGAGLVHETKNPLAAIRGLAERSLSKNPKDPELKQSARMIMEEADRTVARLDEFLLLSRPTEVQRSKFSLDSLFGEIQTLLEPDLENKRIQLELGCSGTQIEGDREQLRRLFINLLLNAIQNLPPQGRIRVSCKSSSRGLSISVSDNGPGIPPEDLPLLFEPYFSRREGGTGLGLSIAQRIAKDHGFFLEAKNLEPQGAQFTLRIPRS